MTQSGIECYRCKSNKRLDELLDAFAILQKPGEGNHSKSAFESETTKIEWKIVGEEIDEILDNILRKDNSAKSLDWVKLAKVIRVFLLELMVLEMDEALYEALHSDGITDRDKMSKIMMLGFSLGKLYHTAQTCRQVITLKLENHSEMELARSVLVKSTSGKKPLPKWHRISFKGYNYDALWNVYKPDSFPQRIVTVDMKATKMVIVDPLMSGWTERLLLDNPGPALKTVAKLGVKVGAEIAWNTEKAQTDENINSSRFDAKFWNVFENPEEFEDASDFQPELFRKLTLSKKRRFRQLLLN